MNCRYCRTPIQQDQVAAVELYVDQNFNARCAKAKPSKCPECGGTGDTAPPGDPTPDAFEYCSYCAGAKKVRLRRPAGR